MITEKTKSKLIEFINNNNINEPIEYIINCAKSADPTDKNENWIIESMLNNTLSWEDVELGDESYIYKLISEYQEVSEKFESDKIPEFSIFKTEMEIENQIAGYKYFLKVPEKKLSIEDKQAICENSIFASVNPISGDLVIIPSNKNAAFYFGMPRNQEFDNENIYIHVKKSMEANVFFKRNQRPFNEDKQVLSKISMKDPIDCVLAIKTNNIDLIKEIDYKRDFIYKSMIDEGLFRDIPKSKVNKEMATYAVKHKADNIHYLQLKNITNEIANIALDNNILFSSSDEVYNILQKELETRTFYGGKYNKIAKDLFKTKDDFNNHFNSVSTKINALTNIPNEYLDEDIVCKIVNNNPYYIKDLLKENPNLVTEKVIISAINSENSNHDFCVLNYLEDNRKTKNICEAAMEKNGFHLPLVPKELITPELIETAAISWGSYRFDENVIPSEVAKEANLSLDKNGLYKTNNDYTEFAIKSVMKNPNNISKFLYHEEFANNNSIKQKLCEIATEQDATLIRFEIPPEFINKNILNNILNQEVELLSKINRTLPKETQDYLVECVDKDMSLLGNMRSISKNYEKIALESLDKDPMLAISFIDKNITYQNDAYGNNISSLQFYNEDSPILSKIKDLKIVPKFLNEKEFSSISNLLPLAVNDINLAIAQKQAKNKELNM